MGAKAEREWAEEAKTRSHTSQTIATPRGKRPQTAEPRKRAIDRAVSATPHAGITLTLSGMRMHGTSGFI